MPTPSCASATVAMTMPQKFGTGLAPSGLSPAAYDSTQKLIIPTAR